MTDTGILELYESRSESAITETAKLYGAYCTSIAFNILRNKEDADECVNDTYLNAWNSIPPKRPAVLSSFVGRITRNLALNRYKLHRADKRGGNETTLLLSELEWCVKSADSVEDAVDVSFLGKAIDSFLSGIKKEDRIFFVRRYWYADSISEIAKRFSAGESRVKTNLHRTRNKLKLHLENEGILI